MGTWFPLFLSGRFDLCSRTEPQDEAGGRLRSGNSPFREVLNPNRFRGDDYPETTPAVSATIAKFTY
jgi:hypothetical protein